MTVTNMENKPVIIRNAQLADIPALNELLTCLFEQEDEFSPDRQAQTRALTQILSHPEVGQILVSCETHNAEHKITGMVSLLFSVSTALGGKVALLEDMVVSEGYRQQGIGASLLQAAIQEAKRQHCRRITLLTDKHNIHAHAFYEKHGFQGSSMQTYRLLID